MPQPLVAGRIPQDIKNKIIQHCQATGSSESQIVAAAVCQYLNLPPRTTPTSVEQRLAELERMLARILEQVETKLL
jgi:hypothetical protein